jgi:apolipoprotein N-acyltransferase
MGHPNDKATGGRARWRPRLLAVSSGVLLAASHPDWSIALAGWVALVPLLLALRDVEGWRGALATGWLGGLVGFLGTVGWLYILGPYTGLGLPFGWAAAGAGGVLLAAYLACFVALFAALVKLLLPTRGPLFVLGAAAAWTSTEWLRGWLLTGFPWGALGYSQWNVLPVAQLASLGSVSLVSLFLALVNAALAEAIGRTTTREFRQAAVAVVTAVAAVVGALVYGVASLSLIPPPARRMQVAVVPGNIPQNVRWKDERLRENFDHYLLLIEKAVAASPELVVIPETSLMLPYLPPEDHARLWRVLQSRDVALLAGMPRHWRRGGIASGHNAAVLMRPDGQVLGEYFKRHLVPFGEYIPLRQVLPRFLVERVIGVGDWEFGTDWTVLSLPHASGVEARIGAPICFESVFPGIGRQFVRNGANLLAVITNDGWYEGTSALAQHHVKSVFRAIETRRAVVRSANRGISSLIEPSGRILPQRVPAEDADAIIVGSVPLMAGTTPYVRLGDWPSALACGVVLGLVVVRVLRRRRGAGASAR